MLDIKLLHFFFAGGTPFLPGQAADYTIAYGIRDAYSLFEHITLEKVKQPWENQPHSFSPALEGKWFIPKVSQIYILALDRNDDEKTNYDAFIINTSRSVLDGDDPIEIGEWHPLWLDYSKQSGAYFLVQQVSQKKKSFEVSVFSSGVYHNAATPRELLEALNEKFGFFPAGGDDYALEHGWINQSQYFEMLERSAKWMAQVTGWVFDSYHPDLLYTWQDAFDAGGHVFLPAHGDQVDSTDETENNKREAYLRSAQIADKALGEIIEYIPLDQNLVFVVSDHGMTPVHTTVNLNTLLEKEGWLILDERNYVIVEKSQAIAFASGGTAHIYINASGVEKDGFIAPEKITTIREQLYQLFVNLKNPDSGELVLSRVLRSDDLSEIHLNHINSGDLFVQAKPGYNLDSHRGWKNTFEPATISGQHGYDHFLEDMQAIFLAAGAGIQWESNVIKSIEIIDIAPTIATFLGLSNYSCDGTPVLEFIDR